MTWEQDTRGVRHRLRSGLASLGRGVELSRQHTRVRAPCVTGISRAAGLALAVSLIVIGLATPPLTAAADDVEETAVTTYSVDPKGSRLSVTVVISVTNHKPDSVSLVPCTRWVFDLYLGWYTVPDVCPQTTRYYLSDTYVWVEAGARNLTITADRGAVTRSISSRGAALVGYRLKFSPIYRNQTRKLTIRYEIVGGRPRSETLTRVGQAYLAFCATTHGGSTELDAETVRIVVPAGFELDVVPSPLPMVSGDGSTVLSAVVEGSEVPSFYRCLTGTNDAALRESILDVGSGPRIRILSWPEDDEWHTAVAGSAVALLRALSDLIGRPPPTREIAIRETASGILGEYAGFYEAQTGTAFVGEDFRQSGLVAHELAHAWFDTSTFASRWMYEGLATWAAAEVAGPTLVRCQPPPYAGLGTPDLDQWPILGPRSSEAEKNLVDALYDEACSLFEIVADRVGPSRMRSVLDTLFDREPAYEGAQARVLPGQPVDWRYLLDVIDERALVPAGFPNPVLAEELFVRYGIAARDDLASREAARAAYHRLASNLGPWRMPAVVPSALEAWQFAAAQSMVAAIESALTNVHAAHELVLELDADNGPVRLAVEGATSSEDLMRAADLASRQLRAAEAVAAARAALAEPRDPIQQLGLLGTDIAAIDGRMTAAAASGDVDTATAGLDDLERILDDARTQGLVRLAGAGVLMLAAFGIGVWLVHRRQVGAVGALGPSGPNAEAEEGLGDGVRESSRAADATASDGGERNGGGP